ncbi:hypothetical protein HA402_008158 [Bradysia odoriphaga]|nr:hypothetical protein HA402_008158 [Bradysia odoriphaga]
MADESSAKENEGDKKIVHTYPLVKHSDMIEEMKTDCIELSITACEKFAANYEVTWLQKRLKMQWIKNSEHFGMS